MAPIRVDGRVCWKMNQCWESRFPLEIVYSGGWGLQFGGTDCPPFHGDVMPAAARQQRRQHSGISMPIKEHSVSSVKDAMINIIGRQPEDSTYDEILRELAYARMVQRGLDDADAGRTVPDSDVRRKIESWQK